MAGVDLTTQESVIAEIAREVVARLRVQLQQNGGPALPSVVGRDGVFATVDEAAAAAEVAQRRVAEMSLEERGRMISIVRRICIDRCEELGRMELEETKVG